jgi:hypothetical protein
MIKDIITYKGVRLKRDMELVREVLLRVEAIEIPPGGKLPINGWDPAVQIEGYSPEDIDRHLRLLIDGDLLTGKAAMDGIITPGLSWQGCEFLDTIRSPEAWRRTKEAAAKIGGVSLAIFAEIAKASAKAAIKAKLGLDLG